MESISDSKELSVVRFPADTSTSGPSLAGSDLVQLLIV